MSFHHLYENKTKQATPPASEMQYTCPLGFALPVRVGADSQHSDGQGSLAQAPEASAEGLDLELRLWAWQLLTFSQRRSDSIRAGLSKFKQKRDGDGLGREITVQL